MLPPLRRQWRPLTVHQYPYRSGWLATIQIRYLDTIAESQSFQVRLLLPAAVSGLSRGMPWTSQAQPEGAVRFRRGSSTRVQRIHVGLAGRQFHRGPAPAAASPSRMPATHQRRPYALPAPSPGYGGTRLFATQAYGPFRRGVESASGGASGSKVQPNHGGRGGPPAPIIRSGALRWGPAARL